jgi:allophycocyanin alpha subunit
VTYGIIAGDVTPIDEIGIIGAKEMAHSSAVAPSARVDAGHCIA